MEAAYEFSERENATVAHLAFVMRFVAVAHLVLGAVLAFGVIRLWPVSARAGAVLGVLAILLIAMGIHLIRAASHFRGIVAVRGHDIENLMAALGELANVYAVQRWTYVAAALAIVLALLTTISVR